MVILYNAVYIYIHWTCIISGFKRQWLYIRFQICSRVLIHSGWWTPMVADVLGWVQNTHVLSEVSKKNLLPNSDPMSYVILNGGFSHFHFPFVRGKLIQTGPNSCSLRSVCDHHPSSPVPTARPDHKDEVTLPWERRSKRAARSAKKVRVEFPKCSVQCVLDN